MAVIYCPDCKREMSDTATVCPSCGYPYGQKKELYQKAVKLMQGCTSSDGFLGVAEIFHGISEFQDAQELEKECRKKAGLRYQQEKEQEERERQEKIRQEQERKAKQEQERIRHQEELRCKQEQERIRREQEEKRRREQEEKRKEFFKRKEDREEPVFDSNTHKRQSVGSGTLRCLFERQMDFDGI